MAEDDRKKAANIVRRFYTLINQASHGPARLVFVSLWPEVLARKSCPFACPSCVLEGQTLKTVLKNFGRHRFFLKYATKHAPAQLQGKVDEAMDLVAEDCIYEDMVYLEPFRGKVTSLS